MSYKTDHSANSVSKLSSLRFRSLKELLSLGMAAREAHKTHSFPDRTSFDGSLEITMLSLVSLLDTSGDDSWATTSDNSLFI